MLLLTLRGTPTIYMGEELGMQNTPIPPTLIRDPAEIRQPGKAQGRDPERTPFPWTNTPGAGFTNGTPWLPIGTTPPLSHQQSDPASIHTLYQTLIILRRDTPTLTAGSIDNVNAAGPILTYDRSLGPDRLTVLLNTTPNPAPIQVPPGTVLATTHPTRPHEPNLLRPDEGLVVRIS